MWLLMSVAGKHAGSAADECIATGLCMHHVLITPTLNTITFARKLRFVPCSFIPAILADQLNDSKCSYSTKWVMIEVTEMLLL